MGSGCTSCNTNVFGPKISDQTVQYTGPAITSLGICTGDTLAEIEGVLLQKIVNYATGVGISIPGIGLAGSSCAALFSECISCCDSCTDLPCLLTCYFNAICTLYTDVQAMQTELNSFSTGYNTACLSGVSSSSPLHDVLQELIVEFCALSSAFGVLQGTLSNFQAGIGNTIGNFLATAITSSQQAPGLTGPHIAKSGTGASLQLNFMGFCPIGVVLPYVGSLSNFSGGVGLANTPVYGWSLANGANGTVNMMGQVPVGITTMGGSLPSNASTLSGSFVTTGIDGTFPGSATVTLNSGQVPATGITGSLNDPGHNHGLYYSMEGAASGTDTQKINPIGTGGLYNSAYTDLETVPASFPSSQVGGTVFIIYNKTGISLGSDTRVAGGGGSHNNMQPSTGVYYIQRMF